MNFSNRTQLDVFSLLKWLVIDGDETCCQFQTRVDDPLMASKISTIFKYQFKNGEYFDSFKFYSFSISEPPQTRYELKLSKGMYNEYEKANLMKIPGIYLKLQLFN